MCGEEYRTANLSVYAVKPRVAILNVFRLNRVGLC
jgi:hypothetical protein